LDRAAATGTLVITTNLRDLTVAAVSADGPPDLTVWPESSIDRDPRRPEWSVLGDLSQEAATAAGLLVAGVALDGPDPSTQRIIGALQLEAEGEVDRYVKRRIVPFGEYVPARRLIGDLPVLAQIPRDAVAGARAQSFEVAPGVFAAVVICFETLFPAIVRSNVLAGAAPAGLVLSITNDASFQESAEPDQHLAQSQMRAIETGRWVVHAALSGASAFVDPEGTVHDRTDLFTQAAIRRDVPLATGRTPFLIVGDVTGVLGSVLVIGLALLGMTARLRHRRPTFAERPHAGR
jgi:apolipoprotein N-acyltransferase